MSCYDRYRHEREGADAARWGERYDADHRERERNARWDSDSCDRAYMDGYERELRRQEERHEEERREKRRAEQAAEEAARQRAYEEELYWAQREEPQQEEPPQEASPAPTSPERGGEA